MKWTDKFRKVKSKPTNNAPKSNSLEPNEKDYNLNGEYVSNEVDENAEGAYNSNEGDYNLGEAYVTSARSKPISSVVWEKEEFDQREVNEKVVGEFNYKSYSNFAPFGCFAISAFMALALVILGTDWLASFIKDSKAIALVIIAVLLLLCVYGVLTRNRTSTIIFYKSNKGNIFIEIQEMETRKRISQLLRYNYFISTYDYEHYISHSLIFVANDSDYKLFSFDGHIDNGIINTNQPVLFFDRYHSKYTAVEGSQKIWKIISLLESSNLERENHLY